MSDKKITAQERYLKKSGMRYELLCLKTTEADIIDKLEYQKQQQGGYSRYIKQLIRKDLEK
ncbi:MAG: hypothetical protein LBN07_00395 [Christensenellaceae bacterium]|jgi:hypothetical protein|nr:hypothetical protein [Christensenellaceae bacterium]